jgi:cytochrome c oxidase accessory protein FixG
MSDEQRIDLNEVAPAEVAEVDLYQKREKIYTRKIEGFFQRLRLYTGWPLLIGYFALPWLEWGGRQAILFDLPARKFHILGMTFWPQDFSMLAFLLIIAAYSLFAVTVVAGRVWCGYTCPQTVWTSIFMYLEQRFEGSRNQRMKLDKAPMSLEKFARKGMKHSSWLFVAFMTGMTFVGYFYPIRQLVPELATLSTGFWQVAWTVFFTLATYINAGWMREQVCKYMCPYARFQSVMFDKDTLIVSYDAKRGDPRGSRKHNADYKELGLGECIDCQLCVQVCPTGIDIRDGLQYECIGCALCIDACDSVMDKMNYPRNLISYTSEHELEGGTFHWLRPRIIGYAIMLSIMTGVFTYNIINRVPLEMTVMRDRGELYVETADGRIENIYTIHIVNMTDEQRRYTLNILGLEGAKIIGNSEPIVAAGGDLTVPLRVNAAPETIDVPSKTIHFSLTAEDNPDLTVTIESRFMKPL